MADNTAVDLSKMKREELVAYAKKNGVEDADNLTMDEIREKLPQDPTPGQTSPATGTAAGTVEVAAEGKLRVKGVKARPEDALTVAIWERHPDHPDGEIFISTDGKAHTVADTELVRRKLADGVLKRA